ncbi:hypothetical protein C8F01DRAFT_236593 [Mycena amicta]|nr:hypothetical protein C8F01DRAFT_236593 [Mycena amicta]
MAHTCAHHRASTPNPERHRTKSTSRNSRLADTCAWVEKQISSTPDDRVNTWVFDQQRLYLDKDLPRYRRAWDDVASIYSIGEDVRWIRNETSTLAASDEIRRRVQGRIRYRLESESVGSKRERAIREGWKRYENGWRKVDEAAMSSLSFSDVPWPLTWTPKTVEEMTAKEVEAFLFSPLHSVGQSTKERVRKALLRWHPDRSRGLLAKIKERDRELVEGGAGLIARQMNEIKSRAGLYL